MSRKVLIVPPYPDHECEGCKQGKPLTVAPYSSIVGQGAIHSPEGWVCMKFMPPTAYKVYQERRRGGIEGGEAAQASGAGETR